LLEKQKNKMRSHLTIVIVVFIAVKTRESCAHPMTSSDDDTLIWRTHFNDNVIFDQSDRLPAGNPSSAASSLPKSKFNQQLTDVSKGLVQLPDGKITGPTIRQNANKITLKVSTNSLMLE
jgi:hypothetical protein